MSASVVALDDYRKPRRVCRCSEDFTCYSHRLVDLAARVEDVRADVEAFRFCDFSTFERLTADVLSVVAEIVADTLPAADREARDRMTDRAVQGDEG